MAKKSKEPKKIWEVRFMTGDSKYFKSDSFYVDSKGIAIFTNEDSLVDGFWKSQAAAANFQWVREIHPQKLSDCLSTINPEEYFHLAND